MCIPFDCQNDVILLTQMGDKWKNNALSVTIPRLVGFILPLCDTWYYTFGIEVKSMTLNFHSLPFGHMVAEIFNLDCRNDAFSHHFRCCGDIDHIPQRPPKRSTTIQIPVHHHSILRVRCKLTVHYGPYLQLAQCMLTAQYMLTVQYILTVLYMLPI